MNYVKNKEKNPNFKMVINKRENSTAGERSFGLKFINSSQGSYVNRFFLHL